MPVQSCLVPGAPEYRSIDRPEIPSVVAGRTRAEHERLEHCSEFAEAGVEIPWVHVRTVPSLAGRLDPSARETSTWTRLAVFDTNGALAMACQVLRVTVSNAIRGNGDQRANHGDKLGGEQ
jgi:hypothetical protein